MDAERIKHFQNQMVSKNFSLWELIKSAGHPELVTEPTPDMEATLAKSARTMLQPLRDRYGVPLSVTSGWRPKELNAAVGGVSGSIHCYGGAFDVWFPGLDNTEVFRQAPVWLPCIPSIRTVIYYPKERRFHIDNRQRHAQWIGHSLTKGVYHELTLEEVARYGQEVIK